MQDQLDYIEEYLKGKLSEDERKNFEIKLKTDLPLQEKVQNHRSILTGIELGFNRELKSILQKEEHVLADASKRKRAQSGKINYFIGIAATVALILTSIFILKNQSLDSNQLYARYYESYPNIEVPVSRSENNIENAYSFYEQGKYERALELFSHLMKENPLDPAPVFYSGICNLEIDNAEAAISFFELVQKLEANKYSNPALWYEALSNLRLNQKQKAIEILDDLTRRDDANVKKAKEILEYLD